jgi:hypothetical protein
MTGFLNESSLTPGDHPKKLWAMFEVITAFRDALLGLAFAYDKKFFQRPDFVSAFNHGNFGSPLRKAAIRHLIFSSKTFRDWRVDRASSSAEVYECVELAQIFSDDSQCEAAELTIRGAATCLVLSFGGSAWVPFGWLQFRRDGANAVSMPNVSDRSGALVFLGSQAGYYDPQSKVPPRDFQTVLVKAAGRFERTGKVERNGRRQVYVELTSRDLFYVDNLHYGTEAHLEAFNQQEEHLGRADIQTGVIDSAAKKTDRRLHW